MDLSKVTIETERLLLVPMTLDHVKDIFAEFTIEITRYMYPKSPEKIEETEKFVTGAITGLIQGTNLQMVVLSKESKEFLGCAGLHGINSQPPEFGIWLKKTAQGNRFGFEVISALKLWADKNLDYNTLQYPVDKDNIPSRKIPEKLGGKIVRQYDEKSMSGIELHMVTYEITR